MDTVTFRLKKTDSEILYIFLAYMKVSFINERKRIDKINIGLKKMCSLEESENNKALQYDFESISEKEFDNQKFKDVLFNDLTEKQRTAFLLNYAEGYSIVEIAAMMGITKQSAKSFIDLALEKILLKEIDILEN